MNSLLSMSRAGKWAAAILLAASPLYAVSEYYSISKSPRALGMGGAFYGLSDDESALFYNPAGLSLYRGGADLMASFRIDGATSAASALSTVLDGRGESIGDLAKKLEQFQGKPIFMQAAPIFPYYLRRGLAVGLLMADVKTNATVLGAGIDTAMDVTAIVDSGLFVGFAGTLFTPKLHVGMNLKGMVRAGGKKIYSVLEIAQGKSLELDVDQVGGAGFGVDADLGMTYEMPEIISGVKHYASVSLNNILATKFDMAKITTGPLTAPQLPRMLTISGRTTFPGFWKFDRVHAVIDLSEFNLGGQTDPDFGARTGSMWKHVNIGVELPMRWLALRAGLRQGNLSAGLGIDARFFQFDVATYAEETAANPGRMTSRRVALRMAVGFGGANPAVPPMHKEKPEKTEKPVEAPAETKPAAKPEVPVTNEQPQKSTTDGTKGVQGESH